MSKSILTIDKEIQRKNHEASELGQMEKKLRTFYNSETKLPEDLIKQIIAIRESNEKQQQEYIDMTLKRDKEAVDKMLMYSMKAELSIIENYATTK